MTDTRNINTCKSTHNIFEYKDVLLGTVKNKGQFYNCVKNKFYHIPAFMVDDHPYPIRYVALYQSVKLWGVESGIRYYGEVESFEKVCRRDIKELPNSSDEEYYRFNIKEWKQLLRPIKITESIVYVCEFTNLFLLTHSSNTFQLTIDNEQDFRLSAMLNDAINDLRLNDENSKFGFEFNGHRIEFANGKIGIYKNGKPKVYLLISNYIAKPGQVFDAIKNTIID